MVSTNQTVVLLCDAAHVHNTPSCKRLVWKTVRRGGPYLCSLPLARRVADNHYCCVPFPPPLGFWQRIACNRQVVNGTFPERDKIHTAHEKQKKNKQIKRAGSYHEKTSAAHNIRFTDKFLGHRRCEERKREPYNNTDRFFVTSSEVSHCLHVNYPGVCCPHA